MKSWLPFIRGVGLGLVAANIITDYPIITIASGIILILASIIIEEAGP